MWHDNCFISTLGLPHRNPIRKPLVIVKRVNKLRLGLSKKYLLGVLSGLIATGIAFIVLFSVMYRAQILSVRSQSSHDMSQLLLASLERPLIQRDVAGMRKLIDRLARQPGITNVLLSDQGGLIRFSSLPSLIGTNPRAERSEGCVTCHDRPPAERDTNIFLTDEVGREVLRSVTPVPNGEACAECHGDPHVNRYTGMLVVDYDAKLLRGEVLGTTLALMGAGTVLLLITLWGGWWFMQRMVLAPVLRLKRASEAVSKGDLAARVSVEGHDELARLGTTFNSMAGNLEQAMAAIRAREAFQQALIDAIPDGVRVIDSSYRIIAANRAYCEQLDIAPDQVLNTHCYASTHCRDEPCVPTLVTCPLRALRNSPEPIKFLDRHCHADEGELEVEVYAAPLYFQQQRQDDFCVVESIRNLAEQVHYSHEQKLSDLGQLAAGVAHEIRNPLTTLQMAFRRFQEDDMDEAGRRDYLELANREIKRCINVSDRLLKLSILPPSHTELVDLNACVTETLSLLNFEAEQRQVQIETDLDTRQLRALATDSELRMIVLNLVQNAFHAMPESGRVRVSTSDETEFLQLSVEDNGHGIAKSDEAYVFDPFFSRRHDGTEGSGLGLAITKSLVLRHGGGISVHPSALGGARFSIWLHNADYLPEDSA